MKYFIQLRDERGRIVRSHELTDQGRVSEEYMQRSDFDEYAEVVSVPGDDFKPLSRYPLPTTKDTIFGGQTPCPRCLQPMDATLVVCWDCWHATNRLDERYVTLERADQWDKARNARLQGAK